VGIGSSVGCDWSTVCISRTDWAAYADAVPARCRRGAAAFLDGVIPASPRSDAEVGLWKLNSVDP
jgi:hypothetical protein